MTEAKVAMVLRDRNHCILENSFRILIIGILDAL